MNWFILALLAPLAWSAANYLDKFILSRSRGGQGGQSGSGGLLVLSSLVSLVFALVLAVMFGPRLAIDSQHEGALILSGMFEALYLLFYFFALVLAMSFSTLWTTATVFESVVFWTSTRTTGLPLTLA